MNIGKTRILPLAGMALLLVAAGLFCARGGGSAEDDGGRKVSERKTLLRRSRSAARTSPAQAVRDALKRPSGIAKPRRRSIRHDPDGMYGRLKGVDRQQAESLQRALDEGEFNQVAASVEQVLKTATNPEVLEYAVEALGWFGADALPELTACMAHADEGVAQTAINLWDQALAEVPDSATRLSVSAAALGTLTNSDALDSISGQFSNAALEYIDGEDDEAKASEKRVEVVQMLLDIIEGDNDLRAEKACEAFEDITGSRWRGVEEAEKYLRDPDNYEEPDEA